MPSRVEPNGVPGESGSVKEELVTVKKVAVQHGIAEYEINLACPAEEFTFGEQQIAKTSIEEKNDPALKVNLLAV